MKHILRIAFAVVCLIMPVSALAVVNGSFEDTDSSYVNEAGWDLDSDAAGTGWGKLESPDWMLSGGPAGLYNTPDGNFFALGAATGSFAGGVYREGVYQSVGGFTVGEDYKISFSHANGLRHDSQTFLYEGLGETGGWQVLVDGSSLGLIASSNDNSTASLAFTSDWQSSSVTFTATAETHEIRFVAYKPDSASLDPTFQFLDSVGVVLVPEPSTFLMVGLTGLLVLRRQRPE